MDGWMDESLVGDGRLCKNMDSMRTAEKTKMSALLFGYDVTVRPRYQECATGENTPQPIGLEAHNDVYNGFFVHYVGALRSHRKYLRLTTIRNSACAVLNTGVKVRESN